MRKRTNQDGIVTLLFILLISVVATFILIIGQSRLLGTLERSKGSIDTLLTTYKAESEINSLLTQLVSGSLTSNNFSQFPKTISLDNGKLTLKIEAKVLADGSQQITVTAKRAFSVNTIQATRTTQASQTAINADINLALDCTGSMNEPAQKNGPSRPTRLDEEKRAALSFIDSMNRHEKKEFLHLGIIVFGVDAKWMKTPDGREIKPDNNIPLADIYAAVNSGFSSLLEDTSACQGIMNATSVGSGLALSRDYFKATTSRNYDQIQVLITDGEPNSRIPYADCPPSVFCPAHGGANYCRQNDYGWTCSGQSESACLQLGTDFLKCTLADTAHGGVRNPNVDSYSVTVLDNPPANVASIFQQNSTQYYNTSNATNLTTLLQSIFGDIITSTSRTTIKRVIQTN